MFRLRFVLAVALVAALATAASAQSWDYFARFTIVATPPYRPCGLSGLMGSAQPVVWNGDMWLFYTCGDGQVVAQHFTQAIVAPPAPPLSPCPGAFVAGLYGGCVPKDHPLARR